jgi:hypothetical protein
MVRPHGEGPRETNVEARALLVQVLLVQVLVVQVSPVQVSAMPRGRGSTA